MNRLPERARNEGTGRRSHPRMRTQATGVRRRGRTHPVLVHDRQTWALSQ